MISIRIGGVGDVGDLNLTAAGARNIQFTLARTTPPWGSGTYGQVVGIGT